MNAACVSKSVKKASCLGSHDILDEIEALKQELAQECARCINTFSGEPMLRARGRTLQCRLKTCNRKKLKEKLKRLKEMEKALK